MRHLVDMSMVLDELESLVQELDPTAEFIVPWRPSSISKVCPRMQ